MQLVCVYNSIRMQNEIQKGRCTLDTAKLDQLFVKAAHMHRHKLHEAFDQAGMHSAQPFILIDLHHNPGKSLKELSANRGVQPATVTNMIDRMEKGGLVRRTPDEKDRRMVRVYLTEQGERMCEIARGVIDKHRNESFACFTEEEQAALFALLSKYVNTQQPTTEELND